MKLTRLFPNIIVSMLALALIVTSDQAFAEQDQTDSRVRVKATTKENGVITNVDKVIAIDSKSDIQSVLRQLGIDGDFDNLADDEVIEISITRKKAQNPVLDATVEIDPMTGPPIVRHQIGVKRAFLGVNVSNPPRTQTTDQNVETVKGAYIRSVITGTGAQASDLRSGDIITAIDETTIENYGRLIATIRAHNPGDEVTITYIREGQTYTTQATLGENNMRSRVFHRELGEHFNHFSEHFSNFGEHFQGLTEKLEHIESKSEAHSKQAFLGVTLSNHGENEGAHIDGVLPQTTAEEMGLQKGDVVTAINDTPIRTYKELVQSLRAMQPGAEVTIEFVRGGVSDSRTATIRSRADYTGADVHKKEIEGMIHGLGDHLRNFEFAPFSDKDDIRVERFFNNNSAEAPVVKELKLRISMEDIAGEEAEALNKMGGDVRTDNDLSIESLALYPNPSTGEFNLNFTLPDRGDMTLRIFNPQGGEVFSESFRDFDGEYEQSIDISDLAKGVYFLQIEQNGRTFSQKIVTQ